jgi:hypothetical protein
VPLLTFKFFFAVLPLLILGYILGTLLIATWQGWQVNPLILVLNAAGILIGIWNFREKYLIG